MSQIPQSIQRTYYYSIYFKILISSIFYKHILSVDLRSFFLSCLFIFILPVLSENVDKSFGQSATDPKTPELEWSAAAPGMIEPKSGLIRVGSQIVGRIAEVVVNV
ncbi:MAG: hypothetical protein ACKOW3_01085, partial [Hyphomicrobium sp.]